MKETLSANNRTVKKGDTGTNWDDIITTSDYLALTKIKDLLEQGKIEEAKIGFFRLFEWATLKEKREASDLMEDLMETILLGQLDPNRKTRHWLTKIDGLRDDMSYLKSITPIITDELLKKRWKKSFIRATEAAVLLTSAKTKNIELTWFDVFDDKYSLDKE